MSQTKLTCFGSQMSSSLVVCVLCVVCLVVYVSEYKLCFNNLSRFKLIWNLNTKQLKLYIKHHDQSDPTFLLVKMILHKHGIVFGCRSSITESILA